MSEVRKLILVGWQQKCECQPSDFRVENTWEGKVNGQHVDGVIRVHRTCAKCGVPWEWVRREYS